MSEKVRWKGGYEKKARQEEGRMKEIKELVEFLDRILDREKRWQENRYKQKEPSDMAIQTADYEIVMLTEIKGIVEQQEIKPIKISKSQGEKIMKKVKDFDKQSSSKSDDLIEKIWIVVSKYQKGYIEWNDVYQEIRKLLQGKK